jgi:hypothetical protein
MIQCSQYSEDCTKSIVAENEQIFQSREEGQLIWQREGQFQIWIFDRNNLIKIIASYVRPSAFSSY